MISFEEARRAVGLTQQQLAAILGITQPAIAAYESGRRRPTGPALAWLEATHAAILTPHRSHGVVRGRTVDLPTVRWVSAISPAATVVLPTRLDWSARREPNRDLTDLTERAATYAQIIEEGSASDIAIWIDPDALQDLWPDLPIARHLLGPVADMLDEIRG